ncbi:restriction endonuclease subunit S [Flavobacterium ginsenosidimutans]|uniref:restriction endonuclease subunit S n=1 Tax=Flavobacterium ginsenosidimutans TaxID=687844 RepID=UPI000DACE383|nr:restriction endonuclease subunit S [Flavobacterium ginsenosidimutans]KAF2335383.1 restriction endonuclease subunit S [Flavobacterium ginsenosidimutans]
MKRYEKYRTANIEGIKEVPHHWKLIKLKYIGNLYSGLTGKSGSDFYNEDSPLSRPYINFKNIANNIKIDPTLFDLVEIKPNEEQNKVKKGDLFFLMSSENFTDIGKTAVLIDNLEDTYLNSFCRGFRIFDENFSPEFLNYLLLSGHYREILSNEAKGFTRINIQVGKINNFPIFAPFDKHEQIQIANFLDYKINLINSSILKKKRLIELLKEKRQAIINEAVTKGLNINVPMKSSGIEWMGEIPNHWEVKKLKYVVSCNDDALNDKHDKDSIINYIEIGDVSLENGVENFTKMRFSQAPSRARRIIKENDIILSTVRTYLKAITKVNVDYNNFIVSTGFAVLRAQKIKSDFLGVVVKSESFIDEIISLSVGVSYPAINSSVLLNISIPVPPESEQLAISRKIDKEFNSFQKTILKIESAIDKLQIYRQSLISEVVTGKIDVRK